MRPVDGWPCCRRCSKRRRQAFGHRTGRVKPEKPNRTKAEREAMRFAARAE